MLPRHGKIVKHNFSHPCIFFLTPGILPMQQYFGREACTMKNGSQGGERRQTDGQRGDQIRPERDNA